MVDKLIEFIREEIGEFKQEILPNTEIENHLGVTGDEAIALIISISKEFDIDISEFDFKKYFHPEPNMFTVYNNIEPLTIQNIADAILTKKLV